MSLETDGSTVNVWRLWRALRNYFLIEPFPAVQELHSPESVDAAWCRVQLEVRRTRFLDVQIVSWVLGPLVAVVSREWMAITVAVIGSQTSELFAWACLRRWRREWDRWISEPERLMRSISYCYHGIVAMALSGFVAAYAVGSDRARFIVALATVWLAGYSTATSRPMRRVAIQSWRWMSVTTTSLAVHYVLFVVDTTLLLESAIGVLTIGTIAGSRQTLYSTLDRFDSEMSQRLALAKATNKLERAVEFEQQLFAQVTNGVMVTDDEFNLLQMNPAARVISESCREPTVVPPRVLTQALESRTPIQWNTTAGQVLLVDGRPLEASDGVKQLIFTFADISDRVRDEVERAQSAKLVALGTFAGGVAHDFNNMLMAVDLANSVVADLIGDRCSQATDLIKASAAATSRMQALTQQILEFARPTSAVQEMVSAKDLASSAIDLVGCVVENPIEVTTSCDDLEISTFPLLVESALGNLLINAAEASEPDQPIRLSFDAGPDQVVFKVIDSGVGIAPENLDRVTEPFFTTKARQGGTGLGLATAASFVARCGGLLSFVSSPERGTTATITLPISNDACLEESISSEPLGSQVLSLDGMHILLIEDEVLVQDTLRSQLIMLGARVQVASDLGEARMLLDQSRSADSKSAEMSGSAGRLDIDVVLCDVFLGDEIGFDVLNDLRQLDEQPGVVFMSGNAINGRIGPINCQDGLDLSERAGGHVILSKPLELSALVVALRGHQD